MSAHMSFPVASFSTTMRLRRLASDPCRRELAQLNGALQERLAQAAERIFALEQTLSEVTRDALTDVLTGLANRRAFDAALRDAAAAGGRDASLLLLDIDHFKAINDSMGHLAGDVTLRDLAERLRLKICKDDLLARYGGEEFAAVLTETDRVAAAELAEQLRRSVEELSFSFEGRPYSVTISLGVASIHGDESLIPQALIRRADECLYRAKREGRNRVVS